MDVPADERVLAPGIVLKVDLEMAWYDLRLSSETLQLIMEEFTYDPFLNDAQIEACKEDANSAISKDLVNVANMIVSKIAEDATTNANIQEEKLKQMEEQMLKRMEDMGKMQSVVQAFGKAAGNKYQNMSKEGAALVVQTHFRKKAAIREIERIELRRKTTTSQLKLLKDSEEEAEKDTKVYPPLKSMISPNVDLAAAIADEIVARQTSEAGSMYHGASP